MTRYSGLETSFTIDNTQETALISGRIFRLKYRAVNEINSSEYSDIVSVAMAGGPGKAEGVGKIRELSSNNTLTI